MIFILIVKSVISLFFWAAIFILAQSDSLKAKMEEEEKFNEKSEQSRQVVSYLSLFFGAFDILTIAFLLL